MQAGSRLWIKIRHGRNNYHLNFSINNITSCGPASITNCVIPSLFFECPEKYLASSTIRAITTTVSPTIPMKVAKPFKWTCRGVSSPLSSEMLAIRRPHSLLIPTCYQHSTTAICSLATRRKKKCVCCSLAGSMCMVDARRLHEQDVVVCAAGLMNAAAMCSPSS
ncbi:unnamed protein product [Lathyrus oleraceus]